MIKKTIGVKTLAWAVATLGTLGAASVQAFTFDGDGYSGSFDSSITAGFSKRLKDPMSDLAATPGKGGFVSGMAAANDGDLNYNKGDLFALYLKGNHELLLKFPDQWKVFARGAWLYDWRADQTRRTPLEDGAKDLVARDTRLLDLWVSKDFTAFGDQTGRVRLGNQVVSWGESLFIPGGINQTNSIDMQRLTMPGVPMKEVVLPAPMISIASGLGNGINVEAYYQFSWNRNLVPPSGTFFSTGDYYGRGKQPLWFSYDPQMAGLSNSTAAAGYTPLTAPPGFFPGTYTFTDPNGLQAFGVPFINDKTPRNGGQWGVAVHYKPENTSVDFGAYYMRYHEKNSYLQYVPTRLGTAAGYDAQWVFPEDRSLFGMSVNFPLGGWVIGAEMSYRPKDEILVDPFGCSDMGFGGTAKNCNGDFRTWRETGRYQYHFTGWKTINPGENGGELVDALGAQGSNLMWEAVLVRYPDINGTTFQGLQTYANLAIDATKGGQHYGSSRSWGYVLYGDLTYDGTLIKGWQVIPNVAFSHAVRGDTPNMYGTWLEGMKSLAIGVNFIKSPPQWQFGTSYVRYFGGNPTWARSPYKDRDWFGATATYNF